MLGNQCGIFTQSLNLKKIKQSYGSKFGWRVADLLWEVFDIKQSTKIAYKKHLRKTCLSGKNFSKNKKDLKNVSNSSKFD